MEGETKKFTFLEVEGLKKEAISVFAGFQFDSDYYTKEGLETAVDEAIKNVEKQLRKEYKYIKLEYTGQKIESFNRLDEDITGKIKNSDICIFEISYKNPNVYFELGYALGVSLSRYVQEALSIIIIQNEKVSHTEIASDLFGRYLLKYHERTDLVGKLADSLSNKTNLLFKDRRFLNRLLWGMYNEKVNIICPHIPKKAYGGWGTRLGERGDFDTVYELATFLGGILECDVKYYTAKEVSPIEDKLFYDHVVIVGGPRWNNYTSHFIDAYHIPFKYEWYAEEDKKDFLCNEISHRKYELKENWDGVKKYITKDYGGFAKLPSKYNDEKFIILINGIETFGTHGAGRAFTYEPVFEKNCKLVLENAGLPPYFAVIIESDVNFNLYSYPKHIRKENILVYDPNREMWVI